MYLYILADFNYDLIKFNPSSQKWVKLIETLTFTEINIPCWSISGHYPVTITRKCKIVKQ